MARAKFLVDAERCIECNACVTACKNEHEVPWGINRRRVVTINDGDPGERSISVACMHCSDAPCMAVCPTDCFYQNEEGVVLHSKDLCIGCGYCFYACPFGAPQFTIPQPSSPNTVAIASLKANCRFVLRCAPQRLFWLVTETLCPASTESVWLRAALGPERGAGEQLMIKRAADLPI